MTGSNSSFMILNQWLKSKSLGDESTREQFLNVCRSVTQSDPNLDRYKLEGRRELMDGSRNKLLKVEESASQLKKSLDLALGEQSDKNPTNQLITLHLAMALGLPNQSKIDSWQGTVNDIARIAGQTAKGMARPKGRPKKPIDQSIQFIADAWKEYLMKKPSGGQRSQFMDFLGQLENQRWMPHISDKVVRRILKRTCL